MVSRAASLVSRAIRLMAVACVSSVCMTAGEPAYAQAAGSSTPAAPRSPTAGTSRTVAPVVTPSAPGTRASQAGAVPAASPTVAEGNACKTALASLGAGDLSAIKSLPPQSQRAILRMKAYGDFLKCLAIAEGSTSYCEMLQKGMKARCLEQYKLMNELKGVPKESLKAHVVSHICMATGGTTADCGKLREAISSHDAAKCEGLPDPWGNGMCPALATGDPKSCEGAPDPGRRATCIALATDDPSRCPKGSSDCIGMADDFARMKKGGLGATRSDPSVAAAAKGKEACTPLLAQLEIACGPPSAPTAGSSTPPPPAGSASPAASKPPAATAGSTPVLSR